MGEITRNLADHWDVSNSLPHDAAHEPVGDLAWLSDPATPDAELVVARLADYDAFMAVLSRPALSAELVFRLARFAAGWPALDDDSSWVPLARALLIRDELLGPRALADLWRSSESYRVPNLVRLFLCHPAAGPSLWVEVGISLAIGPGDFLQKATLREILSEHADWRVFSLPLFVSLFQPTGYLATTYSSFRELHARFLELGPGAPVLLRDLSSCGGLLARLDAAAAAMSH